MYKILTNKGNICYKATLRRCLHIKPSAVLSGVEPEAERDYNSWLKKIPNQGFMYIFSSLWQGGTLNSFQPLFNTDYKHSAWPWLCLFHSSEFCRDKASTLLERTFLLSASPPLPSQVTDQSFQAPSAFSTSQPGSHFHGHGALSMESFTYPRPSFGSWAHTTLPFAPVEIRDTDGVCPENCPKAAFFFWWIHYFYSLQNNYLPSQIPITSILLSHLADDLGYNTKETEGIWYFLTHVMPTYSIFPLVSRDQTFVF